MNLFSSSFGSRYFYCVLMFMTHPPQEYPTPKPPRRIFQWISPFFSFSYKTMGTVEETVFPTSLM